jgi:hypothetical protein
VEKVSESFCVGEIVDRDEVEIRHALLFRSAKHLSADSAEAVDADSYCHCVISYGISRSPDAGARPKVM